jgi:outer membrane receptor protein involved in Fe transport
VNTKASHQDPRERNRAIPHCWAAPNDFVRFIAPEPATRTILKRFCFVLLFALSLPISAQAQNPPEDLSKLSVEDLMNVEVTSVSKKEQKVSQTAAAIFVITQEDIRRSIANNIPDLLRMVPGVNVAQINSNAIAFSGNGSGRNGAVSNSFGAEFTRNWD